MEFEGYSHNQIIKEDIEHLTNLNNQSSDDEYGSVIDESSTENDKEMTKKYDMESKIKRKVINEVIEQLQEMLYKGDNEDIKKRHVSSAKKMIKNTRKKNNF